LDYETVAPFVSSGAQPFLVQAMNEFQDTRIWDGGNSIQGGYDVKKFLCSYIFSVGREGGCIGKNQPL
jgi:hypothetical protein